MALTCALFACQLCAPASAATVQLTKPHSSVLIVLDASGRMHGSRLAAEKSAVQRAVRSLPSGTPVGLRLVGGTAPADRHRLACSDSRGVLPVRSAGAAALRPALKRVSAKGLAPLSLALVRAAKDMPPRGERTIVLVAGGGDSCAPPPMCEGAPVANSGPPLRVDAIGLQVSASARRALQCAARTRGGVYSEARTPGELATQLTAALDRATRDRRPLGKPLAGGLEQSQATPAPPGEYVDSIEPNGERWYSVTVPAGRALSVAATLVAPSTGDVSAPGSSLELNASGVRLAGGAAGFTAPALTNLFAFQPDRSVTIASRDAALPAGQYRIRAALTDSPDGQLAQKLHGRPLALELLFRLSSTGSEPSPAPAVTSGTVVGGASFNDAPLLGPGSFSDAVDTGKASFYRVRLERGQRLTATASLDVSGLDPSVTGASSLGLTLYGALRQQTGQTQQLGPGDPTTHLKTTTGSIGPVRQAGVYYLSASVNDFLPEGSAPVQLPLQVHVAVASGKAPPAQRARPSTVQRGGSSAVVVGLLALAGLVLIAAAGLAFRRR